MREFFHGWRRKVGCVTLVMASAVAAAWIRSYSITDYAGTTFVTVLSQEGQLSWMKGFLNPVCMKEAYWDSVPIPTGGSGYNHFRLKILYWHIAVPLTLLSAYLILWKPCQRTRTDHA